MAKYEPSEDTRVICVFEHKDEEFSKIAVINFFTVLKKQLSVGVQPGTFLDKSRKSTV